MTAVVLYFVIPGTASTTVLVWHSKAVAGSPSYAGGQLRLAGNPMRDHARNFGSLACSGQGSSPPASRRMFSAATRLSLFASFARRTAVRPEGARARHAGGGSAAFTAKPSGTGSSYGCRMGRINSSTFGSSMVDGVGSSLP
jgi:hypothetical protein